MLGSSVTPSRRTLIVAGTSGAALVAAMLVVAPASGENVSAAFPSSSASPFDAVAAEVAAASAARSSSALQRSLNSQSRLLSAPLTAAAARVPAVASRSTTRTAPATAVAKAKPAAKPRTGPAWTWLPVLEPGSRDRAVRVLQGKLGVKVTGWYGPMTLVAVKAFQASRGLPAQGYVGQLTWRALATDFRLGPAPAAAPSAKASSSGTTSSSRSSSPSVGGRICPAPGAGFGQGWGAARSGHSHQGMDMMGPYGSPILAVEGGTIIRAGRQSNGALRIVLQGGSGAKFYYGHMSSLSVSAGQRVSRGQVIGRMGDTGSPGAVHLHFEYWASGGESAAVDPGPLLRKLC